MIKPSEIKTRDKERDAEILNLFAHEHERLQDIADKFGLNKSTISYIISKNKDIIKIDKTFHKLKRINYLERMLDKCDDNLAKGRDASDVLKELRAEYEGDAKTVITNTVNSVRVSELDTDGLAKLIALSRERALQAPPA